MGDDKGQVHEKDWTGEYRPKEGPFGPRLAHPKRSVLTGEPVPARDWLGNQKKASDGSPLYEAADGDGGGEAAAAMGILALVLVALLAVWAFVTMTVSLVIWWLPRLSSSIRADIQLRRLSWTTLGWASPIIAVSVLLMLNVASTPHPSPTSPAFVPGPQSAPAGVVPAASSVSVAYPQVTSQPTPEPTAVVLLPTAAWVRSQIPAMWDGWVSGSPRPRVLSIGTLHAHVHPPSGQGDTAQVDVCASLKTTAGSSVMIFGWSQQSPGVWVHPMVIGYGFGDFSSMTLCDTGSSATGGTPVTSLRGQ